MLLTWLCLSFIGLGGINNSMSYNDSVYNGKLIEKVIQTGNCLKIDKDVKAYSVPFKKNNVYNFTFIVEGELRAYPDIENWPIVGRSYQNFIEFSNSSHITINGSGGIDGEGWIWWKYALMNKLAYNRPNLVVFDNCSDIFIDKITLSNSPQYHLNMKEVGNVLVEYVTIYVNTTEQKKIGGFPLFPLNTDGIDVSGIDVTIKHTTIKNFDDAIAIKPLNSNNTLSNCTENIIIYNTTVHFGVGLSVGSVSPNRATNCIQNILFKDAVFYNPIKAIYIKTNPGDIGDGIIKNITYENIRWDRSLWYGIYIGPQQEKEPDGNGPGCMLYPLTYCPTNPKINISDIYLKNISSPGDLLFSGLIRCNQSNPCNNITFIDVHLQKDYICEYANVNYIASTPPLDCELLSL